MTEWITRNNVSIVTAIMPMQTVRDVVQCVFDLGDRNALVMQGRGTILREHWYQSLMPLISPEKRLIQFVVPDIEVDATIEKLIAKGNLRKSGTGAVFAIPCDNMIHTPGFEIWSGSDGGSFDATPQLKENLSAIFCVLQPEQTDPVSRAAIQAGAHGPIVYYSQGRGLRDQLRWLKITKKKTKEVLVLVVDNADAEQIIEAMVEAGDIDEPGRGFLYRMPVQKGLVSLVTTLRGRHRKATEQQIVDAIDDILGHSHWRDKSVEDLGDAGKSAGLSFFSDSSKKRRYLEKQVVLTCLVSRKYGETIMDAALAGGASGANVSFARFIEADSQTTGAGVQLNREEGIVRVIIPAASCQKVIQSMKDAIDREGIETACIFRQPVSSAITFIQQRESEAV